MSYTWVVKEPGKPAEVRQIEADEDTLLEAAQKIVGGYVEQVTFCRDAVLLCNEDGVSLGLLQNCGCLGTVAIVKPDWGSLSEDQCRKAMAWLALRESHQHPGNDGFDIVFHPEAVEAILKAKHQEFENSDAEWNTL